MKGNAAKWAKEYRDALGTGPTGSKYQAAQRARLLFAIRARPRRSARWVPGLALSVVLGGLALFAGWSGLQRKEPVWHPQVGTAVAPQAKEETLALEDGSRIVVRPHARLAVVRADRKHFEISLERGALQADVEPQRDAGWTIHAGPYRVVVVGTAFSVDFEPDQRNVTVRVTRGRVRVLGADLQEEGVLLGPGSTFAHRAPLPVAHESSQSSDPVRGIDEDSLARPTEQPLQQDSAEPEPVRRKAAATAATPPSSWATLAENGDYAGALALLERRGIGQVLSESSPDRLLLMGNVARYAGRMGTASKAYLEVRRRSPGSGLASLAAFYLARLDNGAGGSGAHATRWLRTYLDEAPQGSLAAEARARLMDLYDRQGNTAAARAQAEAYLRSFPHGSQSARARQMLASP